MTRSVFISSTSRDLRDHRAAVKRTVERLDLRPIDMVNFGSQPGGPTHVSLKEVRKADYFIGVIAHRYGTVPEGMSKSITEQEYNEAVKYNIPRLMYVVDLAYPWPQEYLETGDLALMQLSLFKSRVENREVVSTFTTPEDLAAKVAVDLAKLISAPPRRGWGRVIFRALLLLLLAFGVVALIALRGSWDGSTAASQPILTPTLTATPAPTMTPIIITVTTDPSLPLDGRCPDAPRSNLSPGAFGVNYHPRAQKMNVRSAPGTHNLAVAALELFQPFRVLSGPRCAGAYAWFEIDYGGRNPGWVAEGELVGRRSEYYLYPVALADLGLYSLERPCESPFVPANGRGCPVGELRVSWGAFQLFERGFMIWREEPQVYFVFLADDSQSLWTFSQATVESSPDNPVGDAPPPGLHKPIRGFGRVWGNHQHVRDALGWATAPEQGYHLQFQVVTVVDAPPDDAGLLYLTLPDGRRVAIGVGSYRFWRWIE